MSSYGPIKLVATAYKLRVWNVAAVAPRHFGGNNSWGKLYVLLFYFFISLMLSKRKLYIVLDKKPIEKVIHDVLYLVSFNDCDNQISVGWWQQLVFEKRKHETGIVYCTYIYILHLIAYSPGGKHSNLLACNQTNANEQVYVQRTV